ncbi:hypothetical protein SARC_09408 [Sphaeroforma arctica JP610]|uniref:Uncharacterized protein n=1 Tax=Sphaeroforma arctica JP610 TaxID=667725 RepID=A0A0L0FNW4_9EUKA|nr:hypothetical protein SARC_09408 [Sphaeroforma arctica JP610]KNC78146.1 hypothetical protein SARC_09408 [Sphaeroforma arctica JP610]|eukprot:XP_014152048.1 hypothetical protein SARC_09408 [Sphaeroforma arctica JP610]
MVRYLNKACFAVAVVVVASTSAVQITDQDHLIVTRDTKCITALGSNQVRLEPCSGADSQVWRESVGFFQSQYNGECLTANKDTGAVTSQTCGQPEHVAHQGFEDWKQLIVNDGQSCLGSEDGSTLNLYPASEVSWCQFAPGGVGAYNEKIHAMAFKDLSFTKGSWQLEATSACSVTCGDGVEQVHAVCKGGSMKNSYCSDQRPQTTERQCNAGACARSQGVWTDWGVCSASSCEEQGFKGRVCQGGDCLGNDIEPCQMEGCSVPEARTEVLVTQNQPDQMRVQNDGTKWTAWSKCSNDCGEGTRTSYCVSGPCTTFEEHEDCYDSSGSNCEYVHVESVDGRWSPWSECSVTCGTGSRTRECLGRQGHGADCDTFDAGTTITCVTNVACTQAASAGQVVEQGRTEVLSSETVQHPAYDPNPADSLSDQLAVSRQQVTTTDGTAVANAAVNQQVSNQLVTDTMAGGMASSGGGQSVKSQGETESFGQEAVGGEGTTGSTTSGITGSYSGGTTYQVPTTQTYTTTDTSGLTSGFSSGTTTDTSGLTSFTSSTNPFARRSTDKDGYKTVPVEVSENDTPEMLRLKIALAFHEAELADEKAATEVEKKQEAHELAEKKAKQMFIERLSFAVGHYIGMKDHKSSKDTKYYYLAMFIVTGFFLAAILGVATVFLGAWYYIICQRDERMRKVNAAASAYDMHSNVYLNKHSTMNVPEQAGKDNEVTEKLSGASVGSESDPEDLV